MKDVRNLMLHGSLLMILVVILLLTLSANACAAEEQPFIFTINMRRAYLAHLDQPKVTEKIVQKMQKHTVRLHVDITGMTDEQIEEIGKQQEAAFKELSAILEEIGRTVHTKVRAVAEKRKAQLVISVANFDLYEHVIGLLPQPEQDNTTSFPPDMRSNQMSAQALSQNMLPYIPTIVYGHDITDDVIKLLGKQ